MSRTTALPTLLGLTLAVSGCITGSNLPPPIRVAAGTDAEYVAAGIERPGGVAVAADGRVFFTEKNTGRIRVISSGELLPDPFAEVPVNAAGERGVLGIALHPDFVRNGRVYVFYTRSDTGETTTDPQAVIDNRVVYFVADGDRASGGELFVASLPAGSTTSRISGRIAFDADGRLCVALGDLGEEAAPQEDDALGGKVLRFNDDGTIPASNPTAGSAVFARGFRDFTGLALESQTGVLFASDDNASGNDEINRIAPAGNYGWPVVVGTADTDAEFEFVDNTPNYVDPILATGRENPGIVGLAFNPGAKYGPAQRGDLFYAESGRGRVQRLTLNADRIGVASRKLFAENFPAPIRDIAFSPSGTLYVATDRAILRCVPFP